MIWSQTRRWGTGAGWVHAAHIPREKKIGCSEEGEWDTPTLVWNKAQTMQGGEGAGVKG